MDHRVEAPALTVAEVAERLQIHPVSAYKLIRDGRLPAARIGAALRVRPADLDVLFTAADRKEPTP